MRIVEETRTEDIPFHSIESGPTSRIAPVTEGLKEWPMFERFVSIDWSGAGTERERVDLRVAEASPPEPARLLLAPTARAGIRSCGKLPSSLPSPGGLWIVPG